MLPVEKCQLNPCLLVFQQRSKMCNWWIKTQNLRSSTNPIWKNCYASILMVYWAIPLLNLKLVIVKLLSDRLSFVLFVYFISVSSSANVSIRTYVLGYWSDIICSFYCILISSLDSKTVIGFSNFKFWKFSMTRILIIFSIILLNSITLQLDTQ